MKSHCFKHKCATNLPGRKQILHVIAKSLCELPSSSLWPRLSPFHSSDFFAIKWKYKEWQCLCILLLFPALFPGFASMGVLPYFPVCSSRFVMFPQMSFTGFENRHSLCGPFACYAFVSSISHHQLYFRFYLHNFCLPLDVKFYERGTFVLCSLGLLRFSLLVTSLKTWEIFMCCGMYIHKKCVNQHLLVINYKEFIQEQFLVYIYFISY